MKTIEKRLNKLEHVFPTKDGVKVIFITGICPDLPDQPAVIGAKESRSGDILKREAGENEDVFMSRASLWAQSRFDGIPLLMVMNEGDEEGAA